MPTPAVLELKQRLAQHLPAERLVSEPLRLLAWGTDASFYRLVPQLAVVLENETELQALLQHARALATSLTFRAAGTSLSGQAISDSVLVMLGEGWKGCRVGEGGWTISLQPAVIGAAANRRLAPFHRKIGPDPASIDAAMIGGIAANNASGMCCGTAQNSYRTLASMRVVLVDGSVLDTGSADSRAAFAAARPELLQGLAQLAQEVHADAALAARIRHKFRMKNTTGYSLNALVDFDDPLEILAHLMIGSEGTLGFISEITYRTVPDHPHKASVLALFATLEDACRAVVLLKEQPAGHVAAVELADRAALRSVQGKPGLPEALAALPADAAALLIETRAESTEALAAHVTTLQALLDAQRLLAPARFSDDSAECARLWAVRKGMFPSVGAMRATGTTVIIEDVAFPVPRLAEATLALQALLQQHGYDEAIIFGHALEGNLHFVFTQAFDSAAEVQRYERFMQAVAQLVVQRFDGALKAEHGTGRNMAPFVEYEWGAQAYGLMKRIKALFDPTGLLNPGVILNPDPQAHLRHLKPLPAANALVDKCIECGFCEPLCPSAGLTFTPRQRITSWREIQRLAHEGQATQAQAMTQAYRHDGLDTCAGCGLCATVCPVGIETGLLVKQLRGQQASPLAHQVGALVARNFGAVTAGVRLGLGAADLMHGLLGTGMMKAGLDGLRKLSRGALPKWSPQLARPVNFKSPPRAAGAPHARRVVYFPSCAARNMGPQRGDGPATALPATADALFRTAGFDVVYPPGLSGLCCGQPFESQGLLQAADEKSRELEAALHEASEGGRLPIAFDTSPCAYRMKKFLAGRLALHDPIAFLHDQVMPRLKLQPQAGPVAIHPVCSVRKMGLADTMHAVARQCAQHVVQVDEVHCCGFAGDRGFKVPELNDHALRHLRSALPPACATGYSTSRTCEIGLSEHAGIPYRSLIDLVAAATVGAAEMTTPETTA